MYWGLTGSKLVFIYIKGLDLKVVGVNRKVSCYLESLLTVTFV